MVILTEFRRTATLLLLKDTVEIAEVVKPATVTYFRYRMGAVDQHPTGVAKTQVNDIVTEITSCMQFEEPAEGTGTHSGKTGYIRKTYLILIILVDVVLYLEDSSAVTGHLDLGIAACGKCPGTITS